MAPGSHCHCHLLRLLLSLPLQLPYVHMWHLRGGHQLPLQVSHGMEFAGGSQFIFMGSSLSLRMTTPGFLNLLSTWLYHYILSAR